MAKKSSVRFQMKELKVIATSLQNLADSKYKIQVGIFGNKLARPKDAKPGLTNAEIGFVHEMGSVTRHIPRRSFLLDTFTRHGDKLEVLLKPLIDTLFKAGKVDEYLKAAAQVCTSLVDEAFETGGWGAWPQDAYATIMRKLGRTKMSLARRKMEALKAAMGGHLGTNQPLIDSGQLQQSVSARVVRS